MESGSAYVIKLNQYAQEKQIDPPQYKHLVSSGLPHMKTFKQSVYFNGRDFPEGVGKSKKEAKHNAAKNACEILFNSKSTENPLTQPPDLCDSHDKDVTNFMIDVSKYCQLNKCPPNYIEVKREGPSHDFLFYYKLVIDKKDYPVAIGKTIKEAKQKAAQLAWPYLQVGMNSKGSDESVAEDQISEPTPTIHTSHSGEETDFISEISKYCQQNNYANSYIEVKREGPSHNPQFFYKLVIEEKDYPVAQGKTVKGAKKKAAQLAWSAINKHLSQDSNLSDGSTGSGESEHLAQPRQLSSGSSWIQFEHSSKSSNSQIPPNTPEAVMKRNSGNDLPVTSTYSRIHSEYDSMVPLGDGAFGDVYKARSKHLDEYFAIKEIKTKDSQKSLQEAKVLAHLFHPNIVRYYSSWVQNTGYSSGVKSNSEFLFIEMEYCDGGTLRHWIHEQNKESSGHCRRTQSVKIALQILSGVEYIHSKNLIHRDLKPENILFGKDGNVRIGDFGLVTKDKEEGEIVERTENRGTPNYMAPEQLGVNYDRKVDVFALGLIFFELLWRIATGHERVVIWGNVRLQKLPKEFSGTYTIESHMIKTMLSEKPEARPEASALKTEMEKWNQDGHDQGNQTI